MSSDQSQEPESDQVLQSFHVFPNPLQIGLGEGKVLCSGFIGGDGTAGIVFSINDGTSGEIGSETAYVCSDEPQVNQVYVRCANLRSALVLQQQINKIVAHFEDAEDDRNIGAAMDRIGGCNKTDSAE